MLEACSYHSGVAMLIEIKCYQSQLLQFLLNLTKKGCWTLPFQLFLFPLCVQKKIKNPCYMFSLQMLDGISLMYVFFLADYRSVLPLLSSHWLLSKKCPFPVSSWADWSSWAEHHWLFCFPSVKGCNQDRIQFVEPLSPLLNQLAGVEATTKKL